MLDVFNTSLPLILPYLTIHPYTDTEWDLLPHIILTGDVDWKPSVLDHPNDDSKCECGDYQASI